MTTPPPAAPQRPRGAEAVRNAAKAAAMARFCTAEAEALRLGLDHFLLSVSSIGGDGMVQYIVEVAKENGYKATVFTQSRGRLDVGEKLIHFDASDARVRTG